MSSQLQPARRLKKKKKKHSGNICGGRTETLHKKLHRDNSSDRVREGKKDRKVWVEEKNPGTKIP